MNYSELVMDKQFIVDSLNVSMTSSYGTVYIEGNYLNVQAKAGSNIVLKGEADFFECNSKAHSFIDKRQLKFKSFFNIK